jgi:hypothetical protein
LQPETRNARHRPVALSDNQDLHLGEHCRSRRRQLRQDYQSWPLLFHGHNHRALSYRTISHERQASIRQSLAARLQLRPLARFYVVALETQPATAMDCDGFCSSAALGRCCRRRRCGPLGTMTLETIAPLGDDPTRRPGTRSTSPTRQIRWIRRRDNASANPPHSGQRGRSFPLKPCFSAFMREMLRSPSFLSAMANLDCGG